jgi:hypothetical protein
VATRIVEIRPTQDQAYKAPAWEYYFTECRQRLAWNAVCWMLALTLVVGAAIGYIVGQL